MGALARVLVLLLACAAGAAAPLLPNGEDPADRLMFQGSLAEMRGDLGQALAAYRRVLALPTAPAVAGKALFRLGLAASHDASLEEAGPFLLRRAPDSPEAGLWLDRLYGQERQEELEAALAALPDTIRPALRIQLLLDRDRSAGSPARGPEARELERRLSELLRLDRATWERRDLRPRLFWEQALAFAFRHGKSATVAAWIDSSALARDEPAAWLARARLAAFQEDLVALRRSLERGRRLDSLEVFYPLMEGRLALQDGLPDEALAALERARRLDGRDPGVLSLLAVAQEEAGRPDQAEATLRTLVALAPEEPGARLRLAALLEGQGRRAEALVVYGRAVDEMGREGAGALLVNNYAYLLALEEQDLDAALELARWAVVQEPDNPAFRDTLGWIHFLRGQYSQAEDELLRAYDLCRGDLDPEILEHLARLRHRQGRQEEAEALLEKVRELREETGAAAE
jgi:Flp pilus assembly protein TadD